MSVRRGICFEQMDKTLIYIYKVKKSNVKKGVWVGWGVKSEHHVIKNL